MRRMSLSEAMNIKVCVLRVAEHFIRRKHCVCIQKAQMEQIQFMCVWLNAKVGLHLVCFLSMKLAR